MTQNQRQYLMDYVYGIMPLQEYLGTVGLFFEGEYRFTEGMVADCYQVNKQVIESLLDVYGEELKHNGYTIFEGSPLEDFKSQFGRLVDIDNKITRLGLFSFTALINVGMLLTDNEKAQMVRSKILDMVITAINQRTGGGSRYFKPCDIDSIPKTVEEDKNPLDFDQIINLPENRDVLKRLKQADDEDYNDE